MMTDPGYQLSADEVRKMREKMKYSREQLADKMGVSVHALYSWELGRRECTGPPAHLLVLLFAGRRPEVLDDEQRERRDLLLGRHDEFMNKMDLWIDDMIKEVRDVFDEIRDDVRSKVDTSRLLVAREDCSCCNIQQHRRGADRSEDVERIDGEHRTQDADPSEGL